MRPSVPPSPPLAVSAFACLLASLPHCLVSRSLLPPPLPVCCILASRAAVCWSPPDCPSPARLSAFAALRSPLSLSPLLLLPQSNKSQTFNLEYSTFPAFPRPALALARSLLCSLLRSLSSSPLYSLASANIQTLSNGPSFIQSDTLRASTDRLHFVTKPAQRDHSHGATRGVHTNTANTKAEDHRDSMHRTIVTPLHRSLTIVSAGICELIRRTDARIEIVLVFG